MEKKLDEILDKLTSMQKILPDLITTGYFNKKMDKLSEKINNFVDLHLKLDGERLKSLKDLN